MQSHPVFCSWKVLCTSSPRMEQKRGDTRSFQDISYASDSFTHNTIFELYFSYRKIIDTYVLENKFLMCAGVHFCHIQSLIQEVLRPVILVFSGDPSVEPFSEWRLTQDPQAWIFSSCSSRAAVWEIATDLGREIPDCSKIILFLFRVVSFRLLFLVTVV